MKSTNEALSKFLLIIVLGIVPLQFLHYLWNHINMYQQAKFQNRDGSLFEDIELRKKWTSAFYVFFIARRIILVSIVFSMETLGAI